MHHPQPSPEQWAAWHLWIIPDFKYLNHHLRLVNLPAFLKYTQVGGCISNESVKFFNTRGGWTSGVLHLSCE
jgi:hypothetical protein